MIHRIRLTEEKPGLPALFLDDEPFLAKSVTIESSAGQISEVTAVLDAVVEVDLPADITVTQEPSE